MPNTHVLTKRLVHDILENWHRHDWTIQCFGMLRCYFGDEVRLQIWHHDFQIPGSNSIHDHPWDFTSLIVAGTLYNQRFAPHDRYAKRYMQAVIQPGSQGEVLSEPAEIWLRPLVKEIYHEGQTYKQTATELHRTDYEDGTVTLIHRNRTATNDTARSIWEPDTDWQIVQVRDATLEEVKFFCEAALEKWF